MIAYCILMSDKNKSLVNGPINVFRLEGTVAGINKVVYLFGDSHQPIDQETKCDSYVSADFVNYFHATMEKTDKNIKYDLFYENYYTIDMFDTHQYSNFIYRQKYISELGKYVGDDMNVTKTAANKYENIGSKTFPNLKLHYMDIRSFFYGQLKYNIAENISYSLNTFLPYFLFDSINKLIVNLANLKNLLIAVYHHLKPAAKAKQLFKPTETNNASMKEGINAFDNQLKTNESRMAQYSKKILRKYQHKEVRTGLLKSDGYLNIFKLIRKTVKRLDKCIDAALIIKTCENVTNLILTKHVNGEYAYGVDDIRIRKLFYSIVLKYETIIDDSSAVFVYLTDIYLLRRLLDKDYVTHAMIYTGAAHTLNYVKTLVTNFDFKITHYDYCKIAVPLTKLNDIVAQKSHIALSELFFKPVFKQCADMSKFPEKFE